MSSIWDDPDMSGGNGEFIKFDKVGDGVSGVVRKLGRKVWDDGSVSPQIELVSDDGEEKTLTAGQVRLKLALAEKRPEVGDHLVVEMTEVEKRSGGKTLKHFRCDVTKGGKPTAGAGASAKAAAADDAPPF